MAPTTQILKSVQMFKRISAEVYSCPPKNALGPPWETLLSNSNNVISTVSDITFHDWDPLQRTIIARFESVYISVLNITSKQLMSDVGPEIF